MSKPKKTLSEKVLGQISAQLAHFLADSFVLYTKTLNFHWNMVGPQFFMYHKLLEGQYKELAEALDEIAERIRMLGKHAPGSLQGFLQLTTLKESAVALREEAMVGILIEDHEIMVEKCHALVAFCEEEEDVGTADLIIKQIRFHSKQAWLLRSHLVGTH